MIGSTNETKTTRNNHAHGLLSIRVGMGGLRMRSVTACYDASQIGVKKDPSRKYGITRSVWGRKVRTRRAIMTQKRPGLTLDQIVIDYVLLKDCIFARFKDHDNVFRV